MNSLLIPLLLITLGPGAPPQYDKPAIAVLNLKNGNGVTTGESELISDRLRVELFNTGLFTVMERDQMQQILKEQGFQQSGACTDEGCMVEIGQLLGVKQLITGSIGKLGSMYLLNLRGIDVATGKIQKVVSEDVKGDIEEFVGILPQAAAALAGAQAPAVAEPRQTAPREKKEQEAQPVADVPAGRDGINPECGGRLFVEALHYSREDLKLDLGMDELKDLNEEINDKLLDGFNDAFDERAVLATPRQLAALDGCQDPVVRVSLNRYSTRPARFGQSEGTAEVDLRFYETVGSSSPAFTVNVVKTGDSKRDPAGVLLEAFISIGEEIGDNLGREQQVRKLKKKLK